MHAGAAAPAQHARRQLLQQQPSALDRLKSASSMEDAINAFFALSPTDPWASLAESLIRIGSSVADRAQYMSSNALYQQLLPLKKELVMQKISKQKNDVLKN